MERDFLGLKLTDCVVVKEEFADGGGCEGSGFGATSCVNNVPWPLPAAASNKKPAAFPHFIMPLNPQQQDENNPPRKIMKSKVLPSFDINKIPSGDFQSPAGCANNTMMQQQQFHGDSTYLAPPSSGDASKPSGAQFTIFYNGTVHVFDDFSPEKAQAIIFLAGNGSGPSNVTQFKYRMEADSNSFLLPRIQSTNLLSRPFNSNLPNCNPIIDVSAAPIMISSTKLSPIGSFAVNAMIPSDNNPLLLQRNHSMNLSSPFNVPNCNPVPDVSAAPNSNSTKLSPVGSFTASAMISSEVPQSRKASLARFLEKKRERAMNASPLGTGKRPNNGGDAPASSSSGFRSAFMYTNGKF